MRRSVTEVSQVVQLKNGNGVVDHKKDEDVPFQGEYKMEIKWINVMVAIYLHYAAVYSWFLTTQNWSSVAVAWIYSITSGMGTTVAAHRYFTHRTFKANKPLKIILIMFQTMAAQEPILHWARDHRVHHKFTDTDADPYNSRRGFFFSHMGWLLCKKHPEVLRQGKKIDMSDLADDPMLKFQKRYYALLGFLANFGVPILLGLWCGESFAVCWYGNIYRYVVVLHLVWCVNSVAHIYGAKPYDRDISPTDSRLVGFLAMGEGWHNYHHVFPWDYKTAELPYYRWNISTAVIDFFAWIGWATELKTVPDDIIKKRVLRTGDGSHPYSIELERLNNNNNGIGNDKLRDTEHFWGFGDKEMTSEDMKYVKIL
jgi:stearoyl-CoA desaturase (delta-9 desaturase)